MERSFDGATYRTAYQYDRAGLLTRIKYPEAVNWLEYKYNSFNQLSEVAGFTKPQGIGYDEVGALKSIGYANGVVASYGYDSNRRLEDINVTLSNTGILKQHFSYDNNNNIKTIGDGKNTKEFEYYKNNQLKKATIPGRFLETKTTPGSLGLKIGDYLGNTWLDFTADTRAVVSLDYDASSIGLDFGQVAPGVKKIVLAPDAGHQNHRINDGAFAIYVSGDNLIYRMVPRDQWDYVKDDKGKITITFKERMATRYLKLHVKYDYRDALFQPVNKATFLNQLAKLLTVYQEATSRIEEYQYDPAGNRQYQKITLVQFDDYTSAYYTNSDRLKTDGKYYFNYDANGNVTEKGNRAAFDINLNKYKFTTSGDEVEYWKYDFDLLNRLIKVTKNGTIVSEYGYSPDGLRQVKRAGGVTTHYIFEGTEPIFEKRIIDGRVRSYVYALGKHLARVDGVIGDSNAKKYWYHTDQVGSVRVVSDEAGKVVWNADYFAFGQQFGKNKLDPNFEEDEFAFTGKGFDGDTGLYYYNARWYDADTGRFISEDPVADPNSPNLYAYCNNNPINSTDPTGNYKDSDGNDHYEDTLKPGEKPHLSQPPSGSSGNNDDKNKKHWYDGIKNVWDSYLKYCDEIDNKQQERAVKNAEEYLKKHGITKDDPEYKEKLALQVAINLANYGQDPLKGLTEWFNKDPLGQQVYKAIFGDPNSKIMTGTVDLFGMGGILKDTGIIAKNIENLREWAKQNGWIQKITDGGVEMWGKIENGEFSWRLKIKPEASTREGLGPLSRNPRFDARLDEGVYVNPFTGEKGGRTVGTHIPLGK